MQKIFVDYIIFAVAGLLVTQHAAKQVSLIMQCMLPINLP
jgi:hypothetical protein